MRDPRPQAARRARVLLIDDERALGDSMCIVLGDFHDVEYVARAREALQRLERDRAFDVILCDLMMGEMSGMEFYDRLRGMAPELAERVAFLTGGAFKAASIAFLERVDRPRLEKPFDLSTVLKTIAFIAERE